MKFKNASGWNSAFLRKLIRWTAKEVGLSHQQIKEIRFNHPKDSRGNYSGFASYIGVVTISISPEFRCRRDQPVKVKGYLRPPYANSVETLVAILAHELHHIVQFGLRCGLRDRHGKRRSDIEYSAEQASHQALKAFRSSPPSFVQEFPCVLQLLSCRKPAEVVPVEQPTGTTLTPCVDGKLSAFTESGSSTAVSATNELPPEIPAAVP